MDDGSLQKKSNSMYLHTQGFSFNEVEFLSKELNNKFNLNSDLKPTRKGEKIYPIIVIPARDGKLLHELVSPYIKYGMEYKIPIIK
jgi:LAGLIDADG DNA endonuclease family